MSQKEIIQLTAAVILSTFAAFSFISLISYEPYDTPFGDYRSSDLALSSPGADGWKFAGAVSPVQPKLEKGSQVKNLCGSMGAYLSHFLIAGLGKTSYVLVLLIGGWGGVLFTQKGLQQIWTRMIGGVFFVPACAALAISFWPPANSSSGMSSSGGALGLLGCAILTERFGAIGTSLLLIALTPLSFLLATDMVPYIFAVKGYKKLRSGDRRINALKALLMRALRAIPLPRPVQRVDRQQAHSESAAVPAPTSESVPAESVEAEPQGADVTGIQQILHLRELEKSQTQTEDETPSTGRTSIRETAPEEESANWVPIEASDADSELPSQEGDQTGVQWASEGIESKANPRSGKKSSRSAKKGKAGKFQLPSIDMLDEPVYVDVSKQERIIAQNARVLESTLSEFNVEVRVAETKRGPVVTQYELALAPGIKVGKIVGLGEDIARAMKAQSVRVVAPIPGKSTVGVEIPNALREFVRLRELLSDDASEWKRLTIPLFLGKDITGRPVVSDLSLMPHLLIAGATGSGKSICINSIILSILFTQKPDDVKLLLVDPKMVELSLFKDIPHLMSPVVTDMKKAAAVLEWAVNKMDDRYEMLARVNVRNLASYNQLGEKEIRKRLSVEEDVEIDDVPFYMPSIVIIVDELADLMMVASKEVESYITRLSQKSRAVGIHIILATQRPSVDVITGLIKSNLPARISFQVASKFDSRTILDRIGSEKLLGSGDMLFLPPGTSKLIRAQGTYVSDREVMKVVEHLKSQADPEYSEDLVQYRGVADMDAQERDDLYDEAVRTVIQTQRGSVSLLQNRLKVGYSRAARLIDYMAEDGIVGDYKGSQAREVMITLEDWEQRQSAKAN